METVTLPILAGVPVSPFGPFVPTTIATLSINMRRNWPVRYPIFTARELATGDAIEFAAPPEMEGGNRRKWHGLVLGVTPEAITVRREADDFPALWARADWLRSQRETTDPWQDETVAS